MEIIVSQTESTGSDGRRRAPGFLPGLTLRPHIVLFFLFFFRLSSFSSSSSLKLPGGMLIFRHQSAGQTMCVLFKGYGGLAGPWSSLLSRSFCDSPEGPRPWRAPLAPLRSLIQSAFISLHGNIPSFLFLFSSPSPFCWRSGIPDGVTHSLQLC